MRKQIVEWLDSLVGWKRAIVGIVGIPFMIPVAGVLLLGLVGHTIGEWYADMLRPAQAPASKKKPPTVAVSAKPAP